MMKQISLIENIGFPKKFKLHLNKLFLIHITHVQIKTCRVLRESIIY
ncbi:hypothetical protein L1283_002953 [Sphingobacterium sp. HSC-15S19]